MLPPAAVALGVKPQVGLVAATSNGSPAALRAMAKVRASSTCSAAKTAMEYLPLSAPPWTWPILTTQSPGAQEGALDLATATLMILPDILFTTREG